MKIPKTIKGEKFVYYVKLLHKQMKAEVRWFQSDEPIIGDISSDFKFILLPDNFLSPYLHEVGRVKVDKLKMNRRQQLEAKEYN